MRMRGFDSARVISPGSWIRRRRIRIKSEVYGEKRQAQHSAGAVFFWMNQPDRIQNRLGLAVMVVVIVVSTIVMIVVMIAVVFAVPVPFMNLPSFAVVVVVRMGPV